MHVTNPELELRDGVLSGGLRESVNTSAQSQGSIHDDATATKLGLRGGTVAGSIHMDLFTPHGLELFGQRWFEDGALSLKFLNATTDREPVQAHVRVPAEGAEGRQLEAWVLRDDGMQVAAGTMCAGEVADLTALHAVELVRFAPGELRILANLYEGFLIPEREAVHTTEAHERRLEVITEPHPWFQHDSPWGKRVVTPAGMVQLLYQQPAAALRQTLQNDSVGLFGAIEVRMKAGPAFVDEPYTVDGQVVAIGDSPKTEFFWYDTSLKDQNQREIATMRMQLRFMKASSALYAEET